MRLTDSILRSSRNLRQSRLRTALTMLAISVGAFALMLTLAAGEGARQFIDRLVTTNFNPKSIYVYKIGDLEDNPFLRDDQPKEYQGPKATGGEPGINTGQSLLQQSDLQALQKMDNVERVLPMLSLSVEYATAPGAKKYDAEVKSVEEGIRYETLAGTIPAQLQEGQAILPEKLVGALGFQSSADAIGKQVTVQYSPGVEGIIAEQQYTIVAVAKKPKGLLGGAREIILPQTVMQQVYESQHGHNNLTYVGAIAFAKDTSERAMGRLQFHMLAKKYNSLSAQDLAEQVTQAINIVQYIVGGFGIIALIVSVFGIVNTQFISVLERTRQIGLMKALGMSGAGVLRLFILEAVLIGLGGAAMGIFAAYVTSIFINPLVESKLQLGGNLLIFAPWQVGGLVAALVIVAAIAGLLPAWKAARLHPIEALRTE